MPLQPRKSLLAGVLAAGLVATPAVALPVSAATIESPAPASTEAGVSVSSEDAAKAAATPAAEGTEKISLLSFNDFHGALSDEYTGTQFADTVEDYRTGFEGTHGEGSTLLTSAGDLIGASQSVSNAQQDEPTLEIMNALGLDVSAAGNHEFDKGLDDLTGRVMDLADYDFLAANFVDPETKEPVLTDHEVFDVDGVNVAVIGAVPNNLYATTTGSGLQGNEVIDLVQAVNAVAQEIEAAGSADVIVASYHDGASGNGELPSEIAGSSVFDSIVNGTDESVDVIFNGHTHQEYDYDTTTAGGKDRPVMQAGQSGNKLAAVELEIDPESKEVLGYTGELIERSTQDPAEAADESEVTAEVYALEQAAVAEFEELKNTVIGDIDSSITTDYQTRIEEAGSWRAGGTRRQETTLGNWAADALKDRISLSNPEVDLGVTNSGGLRAELLVDQYTGSGSFPDKPEDLHGKVTLGEILDFAPFGNTLAYFDIPGSSIKQVLEENWQDGDKALHLGWSEELTWTYDESRPQDEKVTGIWISGEPVDLDEMYTIGTLSFLADTSWVGTENSAPDGYEGFAIGQENHVNLGIMDNQAFQEYVQAETAASGDIRPDFAKKAVEVQNASGTAAPGEDLGLTLGNLELDSNGAGDATSVSVEFQPTEGEAVEVGTVEVAADGETADLSTLQAPEATGAGELVMTVSYDDRYESTTEVRSTLEITGGDATPAGDHVVINEAYTNGGSANAVYTHKFVELYNPTDTDISLDGWSLQYRSSGGSSAPTGVVQLSGTIEAGGYYLVQGNSNGSNGEALPAADASTGTAFSGTNGTLVLSDQSSALSGLATGSITEGDDDRVVDLLGYGTSNTFETAAASAPAGNSDPKSMNRTDGVDSDDNSADFSLSETVTPTSSTGTGEPGDPGEPVVASIAEIQGTEASTPFAGQVVTTEGVVTAVYSTGGLNGYYLQTAGSGGDEDTTPGASDAIFVYSRDTVGQVAIGDHVRVTGEASEYHSGTQLTVDSQGLDALDEPAAQVKPTSVEFPADEATKEAHEGMLLDPSGMEWTITDNHDVNAYGSLGLAPGASPLPNPTSVADPGAAAQAVMAENAEQLIVLDDGASTDFMRSPGNQNKLPYLNVEDPVRVGSAVTFTAPVILDYRFDAWNFQPTQHLTHENADEVQPATFENTRAAEAAPEDVGGNVQLASFNVLNYFTTLGDEFDDCDAYEDHEGNPIATDYCTPRGAYNEENFLRQQEKLVAAINGLDASVVALEEIENSAAFGKDRDEALAALVSALNQAHGTEKWAFAESPAEIPGDEDVIRNAFIYQPAAVETVGESTILTGDPAFDNAREPLAQTFRALGEDGGIEGTEFVALTNHFKSKGSGSGAGNEDSGDGQGNSNGDRVAQAESLVDFAEQLKSSEGTDRVFLMGDFNAYEKEDPIKVLEAAGYVSQGAKAEGEYSYTFDAGVGSLDGIYASAAAEETVTGADIWMINANESVALEYSRYNYTPEQLFTADQWRSSDHNPILVGVQLGDTGEPGPDTGECEGHPGHDWGIGGLIRWVLGWLFDWHPTWPIEGPDCDDDGGSSQGKGHDHGPGLAAWGLFPR